MQVNLYATFRLIVGEKSLELDLPDGTTVRQALEAVVRRCPGLRRHWLDAEGEVYPHVHVFVNDQEIATLPDGLETPLRPTDRLDFFPPVAGG